MLEGLPNFKGLFVKWGWTRSLVFSISWRTCWPPRARAITHSCALVALATDGQPELLLFLGHSHRWKTQSEQGKEISHPIFKDMIPFLLKELLGCSNVPKLTRKRLPSSRDDYWSGHFHQQNWTPKSLRPSEDLHLKNIQQHHNLWLPITKIGRSQRSTLFMNFHQHVEDVIRKLRRVSWVFTSPVILVSFLN